jgi:hypothetical protein
MFLGIKVAEEGLSKGEVVGMGDTEKAWPEWAVAQLGWAMNGPQDIGLFTAHEGRGQDRERVGDVVSGFHNGGIEEDKPVEAFAIGYMSPGEARQKVRDSTWDTASIEGEVVLIEAPGGQLTVDLVLDVTGIALGNRTMNQPGFPGAGIVAVVQEFSNEREGMEADKTLQDFINESTPAQIAAALSVKGVLPSQIFTVDQLGNDTGVKQISQKVQTDLDQSTADLEALKTENETLKKTAATATVGTQIDKHLKVLTGLSDEEKGVIQEALDGQDFSAADNMESAVGDAIGKEVDKLNRLRQSYGQKALVKGAPAEDEEKDQDDQGNKEGEKKVDEGDPFLKANSADSTGELVDAAAA